MRNKYPNSIYALHVIGNFNFPNIGYAGTSVEEGEFSDQKDQVQYLYTVPSG